MARGTDGRVRLSILHSLPINIAADRIYTTGIKRREGEYAGPK